MPPSLTFLLSFLPAFSGFGIVIQALAATWKGHPFPASLFTIPSFPRLPPTTIIVVIIVIVTGIAFITIATDVVVAIVIAVVTIAVVTFLCVCMQFSFEYSFSSDPELQEEHNWSEKYATQV
jgi:hypothetical protein